MSKSLQLLTKFFLSFGILSNLIAQTYNWKSVQIKGGGFVSGLIYSKADPKLLYARTDIGGAYRCEPTTKTWTPITDGFTNDNDMGIWSLAPDPTNANKVYLATGLYSASWGTNGSVYMSNDKGANWTKISSLAFKLGGNDPGRGMGEFMAVDPNRSNILFLGSKKEGLYKSTDSGVTWTKVTSLSSSYITFVEFDKSTGTSGNATPAIYVGVADNIYNGGNVGVYKSNDGGATWSKLTNHPTALTPKTFAPGDAALTTVPTRIVIASGNTIYFTFCNTVTPDAENSLAAPHNLVSNGAVYKYNKSTNAWTNITPSGSNGLQGGYSAITVSSTDVNKIAISTIGRWWPYDELYFSTDGGSNWSSTFNSYNYASSWGNSLNKGLLSTTKAPYASQANIGWPVSIVFNPSNDKEVMFGTGGGVFACYDVSPLQTNATSSNTAATTWVYENDGLEETAALEIVSPPTGAPLISALGDVDGFVHNDLNVSPINGKHFVDGTHSGTNRSIAFAESVPAKMVRAYDNNAFNKGAYSTDGGVTWTKFATKPTGVNANDGSGRITISADGNRIVWASANATIAYSTNNGSSWTASTGGVPNGLAPAADRVNSAKFYVFDPQNQNFYYSTNGAVSFTSKALGLTSVPNYDSKQPQICAVFGKEGHVLLANNFNGLYRTTDGGLNFTKITTVTEAYKVTVGKAKIGATYPAIFIWGIVNNVNGLFRSDDEGATWERINDAAHEYGRAFSCMAGDPRIYGRVYVGAGGRGIIYGDRTAITDILDLNESNSHLILSTFPNPFSNKCSVSLDGVFDYELIDQLGKICESGTAKDKVDFGLHQNKGIYILKISNSTGHQILKVIKE